jgi:hypothetical protein
VTNEEKSSIIHIFKNLMFKLISNDISLKLSTESVKSEKLAKIMLTYFDKIKNFESYKVNKVLNYKIESSMIAPNALFRYVLEIKEELEEIRKMLDEEDTS